MCCYGGIQRCVPLDNGTYERKGWAGSDVELVLRYRHADRTPRRAQYSLFQTSTSHSSYSSWLLQVLSSFKVHWAVCCFPMPAIIIVLAASFCWNTCSPCCIPMRSRVNDSMHVWTTALIMAAAASTWCLCRERPAPLSFSRSKKAEESGCLRLFYGHPRDGMFDNMSIGQAFSLQANTRPLACLQLAWQRAEAQRTEPAALRQCRRGNHGQVDLSDAIYCILFYILYTI